MSDQPSGIDQLHQRRERRGRHAPTPRHPKLPAIPAVDGEPEAGNQPSAPEHPATISAAPAPKAPQRPSGPPPLPKMNIDLSDPTTQLVSPTVLSIPASITKRFEKARAKAPSHTALVFDALRAHTNELPDLILARRPGPKPGDLFPFRETPGRANTDTPMTIPIRPTKGELAVMKTLVDWASACIAFKRPGTRDTNRSEMVAAALDAYLPR